MRHSLGAQTEIKDLSYKPKELWRNGAKTFNPRQITWTMSKPDPLAINALRVLSRNNYPTIPGLTTNLSQWSHRSTTYVPSQHNIGHYKQIITLPIIRNLFVSSHDTKCSKQVTLAKDNTKSNTSVNKIDNSSVKYPTSLILKR